MLSDAMGDAPTTPASPQAVLAETLQLLARPAGDKFTRQERDREILGQVFRLTQSILGAVEEPTPALQAALAENADRLEQRLGKRRLGRRPALRRPKELQTLDNCECLSHVLSLLCRSCAHTILSETGDCCADHGHAAVSGESTPSRGGGTLTNALGCGHRKSYFLWHLRKPLHRTDEEEEAAEEEATSGRATRRCSSMPSIDERQLLTRSQSAESIGSWVSTWSAANASRANPTSPPKSYSSLTNFGPDTGDFSLPDTASTAADGLLGLNGPSSETLNTAPPGAGERGQHQHQLPPLVEQPDKMAKLVATMQCVTKAKRRFRKNVDLQEFRRSSVTNTPAEMKKVAAKLFNRSSDSRLIEEWKIPHDQLVYEQKIGSGSFGTVYKGRWHGVCAIKRLNVTSPSQTELEAFENEVRILRKTRHAHVLLFLGACIELPDLAIVTQWCPGQSLFHALYINSLDFSVHSCMEMAKQAAEAMDYLHAKGIIHRDLKSPNLLLADVKSKPHVYVADFGLATVKTTWDSGNSGGLTGSIHWMAPELFTKQGLESHNATTDVYAYGIILYELFTRALPYNGMPAEAIIYLVGRGKLKPDLSRLSFKLPQAAVLLLSKCIAYDAANRPDFLQILDTIDGMIKQTPVLTRSGSDTVLSERSPTGLSIGWKPRPLSFKRGRRRSNTVTAMPDNCLRTCLQPGSLSPCKEHAFFPPDTSEQEETAPATVPNVVVSETGEHPSSLPSPDEQQQQVDVSEVPTHTHTPVRLYCTPSMPRVRMRAVSPTHMSLLELDDADRPVEDDEARSPSSEVFV